MRTLLGLMLTACTLGFSACAKRAMPEAPPPGGSSAGLSTRSIPSGIPGIEIGFEELRAGDGERPTARSMVKVHYEGRLTDGTVFDSSYERFEPTEFPLQSVIRCWTVGVQEMRVGGKARLTCPPGVAYGNRAVGDLIPANATLIFEIELLEVFR